MSETVYLHEAQDIIYAMGQNNRNLINALTESINNLAMNTGNKTTREYNELKKKYTELENKYNKSDSLLKSIITIYSFVVFNYNHLGGPLNSDKIVEIIERRCEDVQKHDMGLITDEWYENIINIANEVHEKLMRR